jgi:hypothetical protein
VFCASDITQLFSAVLYVVRAVHKFYFRLAVNEYLTNGDQWKDGHAVTETSVFHRIYMFFPCRGVAKGEGASGAAAPGNRVQGAAKRIF